ncbi:CerR family C-terminal domain-containing protein [Rouxiella badensis]|jgi:AcrR family transcriptional regulator|uniref:TetR family transcriptional regulator n=1 Tax=Rouxiella badensis TaxID=1646377 RepID=A0A1X0WDC0_9GAMM|nr:CerR family C-terminal domain-containing protein [Rouxiella badensis]MCC3701388.1 CerR family C-terminal domain-containing protein [Rouxiella badensis]MCC3735066.1 CerR family C-terminal domain-containing protein [Rouxiella badensis]MCC3746078.1 CerR family C-terminal domain-containing protein [Rouxiella badensis]MCC3758659.1 CerR family C-terminal domain-containing protein [Rouxiella badensis]ORJ24723.1 TetR family transcriptional regulator [Rouxiella badensis]
MTDNALSKQLRHPPSGGYARGDETRQRIIESAIVLFGELGFEGASTRAIARHAGVNTPALQYYFENKEGLYVTCADYLAEESYGWFEPLLTRISKLENPDPDTCIEMFCLMLETVLERVLNNRAVHQRRLFHARIKMGQGPEKASLLFQEKLIDHVHRAGVKLVSRISGNAVDNERTQIRVLSLFGLATTFYTVKHPVFNADEEGRQFPAEQMALIKSNVREQCQVLMRSWMV